MKDKFSGIISSDAEKINKILEDHALLRCGDSPKDRATAAEVYALSAGGKRIRPVLAVEFYRLFSGEKEPPEYVYEAACALEITHTFSLIHDDMPEMDDDDMRRGKPSTHVAFGCAEALLAGDGLAILPYELLSDIALRGDISPDTAVRLINILSQNAGNSGMIAGQMLDLWSEERTDIGEEFLTEMSFLKTGCMLIASCLFGAVMAGATPEQEQSAAIYAKNVGLGFQIIDDVLDVTADPATLGKPVKSDIGRHKPTFADIYGTDGARQKAEALSEAAAHELEKYPGSELLREFALSLASRNK